MPRKTIAIHRKQIKKKKLQKSEKQLAEALEKNLNIEEEIAKCIDLLGKLPKKDVEDMTKQNAEQAEALDLSMKDMNCKNDVNAADDLATKPVNESAEYENENAYEPEINEKQKMENEINKKESEDLEVSGAFQQTGTDVNTQKETEEMTQSARNWKKSREN